MTLQSPASEVTHQGNGVTTVFPYSFRIDATDEVIVFLTDRSLTPEVITTIPSMAYSISGIGNDAGGNVTYNPGTPLAAQRYLTIQRNAPFTQEVDITNQGAFLPEVLEGALDRIVMQTQQLNDKLNRAVLVPVGSSIDADEYLDIVQDAAAAAQDSASDAANSESNAATSATNASNSASASATSASNASTSATNAANSASAAATSASNAAISAGAADAAAGFQYNYSSTTTSGDPGSGSFRFNNATMASVTQMYISETTALSQAVAAVLGSWDDSTSSVRGTLKFVKRSDLTQYAIFNITGGITDNGTWDTVPIAFIAGNATLTNGDSMSVVFSRTGDQGSGGGSSSSPLKVADTVGGTDVAIQLTFNPPFMGAVPDKQLICFRAAFNSANATTISVDGGSAIPMRKYNNSAITFRDFYQNDPLILEYNSANNAWVTVNGTAPVLYGSQAVAATVNVPVGVNFLTLTGTATITSVAGSLTPGQTVAIRHQGSCTYTASANFTLPNGVSSLSVSANDIVLVYCDFGAVRVVQVFRTSVSAVRTDLGLVPGTGANNIVQLDGSGKNTALGIRQESTLSGSLLSVANGDYAHGLGGQPVIVRAFVVCAAVGGYLGFDYLERIQMVAHNDGGTMYGVQVSANATNVRVRVGSGGIWIIRPDTNVVTNVPTGSLGNFNIQLFVEI